MKKIDRKFYVWLLAVEIGIGLVWYLLEFLFYGEIQPRIVDECISLLWTIAIFFAYRFKDNELKRYFNKYI